MPTPQYPDTTPIDSRWCWVTPVPSSWTALDPATRSARVMAVLTAASATWNGGPTEVSFGEYQGEPAIYTNADADPSALFDGMAEPPPTPAEDARAEAMGRLQAYKDGTYEGDQSALLMDVATLLLPEPAP